MRSVRPLIIASVCSLGSLFAQDGVPGVDRVFHEPTGVATVKESVEPPLMLVSAADATAAKLVSKGFVYIAAGWDVAAYRHFCAALKKDDTCLMAHVGVALSLASPQYHELALQRKAAILRMVELVGVKKKGEFVFPEKERGFALATSYLFVQGKRAGASAFTQLAERYQNDEQIQLIAAILKRDGYNSLGLPKSGEAAAISELKLLLVNRPKSILVKQYYLNLLLEAPVGQDKLREILPVARQLASGEGVEVWQHWLGLAEYRCGNLKLAEVAFSQAVDSLLKWKEVNSISNADAGALWKAYLYLAEVKFQLGKKKAARKIAKMFKTLKVDENRLWAKGSQLIIWDGYTLGMRMAIEPTGSVSKALAEFPSQKIIGPLKGKSAVIGYLKFYQNYLALRKALVLEDKKAMRVFAARAKNCYLDLAKINKVAFKSGEVVQCMRHLGHVEMLNKELMALLTEDMVDRSLEYSQLLSKQPRIGQMLPPLSFYSMDEVLVNTLQKRGLHTRAVDVAKVAVEARPSRLVLWQGLRKSAKELKQQDLVAEADEALLKCE